VLVWWWCGTAVFFLSGLRLRSSGRDPLGRGAAVPPAGLRGRGCLPPSSSSSYGGAASLDWGLSASSRTRSATSSPTALLLLRLAPLAVTVDSPEVNPPQIPFAFILGFALALF
jgi:hypothetical protein